MPMMQNMLYIHHIPVCMFSEPSTSLHVLRQKFAGSQVTTRAALFLFASKFPLIWAPVWLKQVAITYLKKASIVQKLPGRNGLFHIL